MATTASGQVDWNSIDIIDDPALLQRYGIRIPVLRHDVTGDELGWPFDAWDLQVFLSRHGDRPSIVDAGTHNVTGSS